jgi:hypothetical protein
MKNLKYFNYFDANGNEKTDKTNLIAPNAPVILTSERNPRTPSLQELHQGQYTTNSTCFNWWVP